MHYTELSLKTLREVSIEAAEHINQEEKVDLIVYVARAGYPIAKYMNEIFRVDLIGIDAQRKGNKLKSFLGPMVAYLPRIVRDILITIELKSKVHKNDTERKVEFHKSINDLVIDRYKTILIVDDSVDTGNSIKMVYKKVGERFLNARIKTYSLNVWKQGKDIFEVDYCSYEDTVIKAPMSKDSREFKTFSKIYESETQNGYV